MRESRASSNPSTEVKTPGFYTLSGSCHQREIKRRLVDISPVEIGVNLLFSLNITSFLAVGLAANGLSVVATSQFLGLALLANGILGIYESYLSIRKSKTSFVRLPIAQLLDDLIFVSIIVINILHGSPVSAPIMVMGLCAMALILLIKNIRSPPWFFVGKAILLMSCLFCFYADAAVYQPLISESFPLIIFMGLVCTAGYWFYLQRIRQLHLEFNQLSLKKRIDQDNKLLSQALQAEHAVAVQLNEEHQRLAKIVRHVGHDLRQPLTALSYAFHAIDRQNLDAKQIKNIGIVERCVESADTLIDEILEISTKSHNKSIGSEELKPEDESSTDRFSLGQLLIDLGEEYQNQAGAHKCEVRVQPTTLMLNSNYDAIRRVVSNLINNALKHAFGSPIVIGVRRRETHIEIQVLDRGPGIPSHLLPEVFDEYTQGEKQDDSVGKNGRGLGLNIATALAHKCDAKLRVSSIIGKGTCVSLVVPKKHFQNKVNQLDS